jgi:hypothetical protein
MNRIVSDRLSQLTPKTKEKTPTSQLYFVECITELIDDIVQSAGANQLVRREITLAQLSLTNCDIWIALPGGITLEGANRT